MKTRILLPLCLLMLAMTSCVYVDNNSQPAFYDSRLYGYWRLVEINYRPIYAEQANYLFFNGSGSGMYFYYDMGRRYQERMTYKCYGSSRYNDNELSIWYEYDTSPSTMTYYFNNSGNNLVMQFYDRGVPTTYVYTRMNYAPW